MHYAFALQFDQVKRFKHRQFTRFPVVVGSRLRQGCVRVSRVIITGLRCSDRFLDLQEIDCEASLVADDCGITNDKTFAAECHLRFVHAITSLRPLLFARGGMMENHSAATAGFTRRR